MTNCIDSFIYTSSKNGKTKKYNLKDNELRNMIAAKINIIPSAANAFCEKAKHGFGSEYSEQNVKFTTVASAISNALPHWKICT